MQNLEKTSVIDKESLDGEFYFQSLLEQAHAKGMLTDSDIERLQYDCLALLARRVERYNAGDSSSIRVEAAQSIMASNLFTISIWLKTFQNPDDAIAALQNEPIAELYKQGRKRIDTMISATKIMCANLLRQLADIRNVFYRATLVDGIHGFFKLYYPDFGAHETHITADYPTCIALPRLAGIEFIHAYLEALYYENQFLLCFAPDDLHQLLCGYEEGYQELLINVFEPVLTAALGCVLAETDARRLELSEDGAAHLNRLLADMTKSEKLAALQAAAHELVRLFGFSPGLERYVQRTLPHIADNIKFFAHAYPEHKPTLHFSFGCKMDDAQYRRVVGEIKQCRFTGDKIAIIKEQVHSLADMEDILLDAELGLEEIMAALRELDLSEIAALAKKYPAEPEVDLREQERTLSESLHQYIASLPAEQQAWVSRAVDMIDID